MTKRTDHDPPETGADLASLARDWITLWQSELAALATDREAHETLVALLGLWVDASGALAGTHPRGPDGQDRRTGSALPAWPPSAAAAPDARDAQIASLSRRVALLEQRLAELERHARRNRTPHRRQAKS
ncbi:MAG: hypothetical protein J2P47_14180 [Acetobacteraceae bacterium]|nr:hypothetical protein [Acetobacteraceae bacterium]